MDRPCGTYRVDDAEPVVSRLVAIRGMRAGAVHVWAESLLVPRRLPPGLLDMIAGHWQGIGAALQSGGVETCRELLWIGRMPGPLWPCDAGRSAGVGRTYRIKVGGRPAMLITERFAERDGQ